MERQKLAKQTINSLRAILRRASPTSQGTVTGQGTGRHDLHVRILAALSDDSDSDSTASGLYRCVPTYYDPQGDVWEEFEEQRCKSANDEELQVDGRYRAICYGAVTELMTQYLVFAAGEPGGGGGGGSSGGGGSGQDLELDCGLYFDEGKLRLNMEELAFDGLYANNEACILGIDYGCGLTLVGSQIVVDVESFVGAGLETDDEGSTSSSGDCPKLKVKAGCGITVDDTGVSVKTDDIAGLGLRTTTSGSGCDTEIEIDPTLSDGPTFTSVTNVYANECGFCYDYTTYQIKINPAGVFMGIEVIDVVTYCEELSCPTCCDDSDSDSDSTSTSDDSCTGYYCCEETGIVTYVANCDELPTCVPVVYPCGEDYPVPQTLTLNFSGGLSALGAVECEWDGVKWYNGSVPGPPDCFFWVIEVFFSCDGTTGEPSFWVDLYSNDDTEIHYGSTPGVEATSFNPFNLSIPVGPIVEVDCNVSSITFATVNGSTVTIT